MLLPLLYWLILILSVIGLLGPATWPSAFRVGPSLILFIIIGLRLFRVAL